MYSQADVYRRHFLWIGDRTRDINGAHIEYFRNIRNPIGLKAGPTLAPEELVRLLDILDPYYEPGKVTIIGRYGVSKVSEAKSKSKSGAQTKPCASLRSQTACPRDRAFA